MPAPWRVIPGLKRGERGLGLLLMATYAVTLFGLYLLKPARDSLFLTNRAATDLPLAFMLTAAIAVPVSLAYGRASRSLNMTRLHLVTFLVVIASLVIWLPLLEEPGPVASVVFYAWTAVAGGLVAAQFWLLGNAVCDARRAKRLFPLLSLGGIAGAVLGGWVVGQASRHWGLGPLDLILICAAVWTLALGLSWLILRRRKLVEATPRREPQPTEARPWRHYWGDLRGSRHLMLIIGIVTISVLVTTFIDYMFKATAAASFAESADLLAYLGTFYARMNLLSFLLQLVLTSRLLRGLGVGGSLMVLPVALTLGSVALLIVPGLAAVAALRAGEMGLKYSLDKTSRELLYLPLPLGLKRRVKVFIDTFVERVSRGLAGLMLLLLTSVVMLPDWGLVLVVLAMVMVWIALAAAMRRQYIQSFRHAVARRDIDRRGLRPDLRDQGVMTVLEGALAAENPREVAYALAMLQDLPAADLPDAVVGLLDHPGQQVRQRALAVLVSAGSDQLAGRTDGLLDDPDPDVGRLAAAYLYQHRNEDELRAAAERSPAARASIFEYLSGLPVAEQVPVLAAAEDLRESVAASDPADDRPAGAAAAYLGRTWTGSVSALCEFLAAVTAPAPLVGKAVEALGRQGDRRHLRALTDLLADRALRNDARRALTGYGPSAVPVLVDVATADGAEAAARRAALRALARIPYQRTVDLLLERVEGADAELREAVVPVLIRLRERRGDLQFRRATVERLVRRSVADIRRDDQITARLGPPTGTDSDRLLRRCLQEKRFRRTERVIQLVALLYDLRDILGAWLRITGHDRQRRSDALEFLENLLAPHHKLMLTGLREPSTTAVHGQRARALRDLIGDQNVWVRCCAVLAVDESLLPELRDLLEKVGRSGPPLLTETVTLTLDSTRRSVTMLTIEKAILLESVDHFDLVDSEHLAAIAAIAEEVSYTDGEEVFRAGDVGDAMYLVVDGEVAMLRGEEEIARAGAREAFGSWALFEVEPRMANAVARTESRLLRIDREDFADLMAEDIHVAQGLLKSVARRLRQLASRAA